MPPFLPITGLMLDYLPWLLACLSLGVEGVVAITVLKDGGWRGWWWYGVYFSSSKNLNFLKIDKI